MIFQISKSILLALSALLMLLTACTQTPNYAPVKMVNQAIEPNNGYYFRKKVPTRPLNKPDKPQETAKSALNEQQDNPVGQPPASNNLPYPSPYQNKPSQNYSTDQAVKKEPIPSSTLGIAAQNQGVRKPNPLPYTVESLTKNKSAHPGVDKDSISSQHESPITDQQTNNHPKNKSIPSSANPIASQKTPQHNAQPPDNNLLASKNIKEKTSIISIDNKKMLKLNFEWPLKGKISRNFAQTDNKGIDITGKTGQAVQAAAAGKAVYCGQGLTGFGNLVIIKHNANYLSAYANNSKLYIKEGQQVDKGQAIGQVGATGLKRASLHFEIRKNGKPINPLSLLPKH